ncbi:MAG: hypothetical protein RL424_930, partial [Pseudomonadota bacterium]
MPLDSYPSFRARRQRRDDWSRRLVSENSLTINDLIYPVFITEGTKRREKVSSMPGVERLSLDLLMSLAEEASMLEIPVLAVFPVIEGEKKDLTGSESFNPGGLVPRTVSALKKEFPKLGVMTDVALDPYTSHGQDGLIDDQGRLLNDETVEVLVKQALVQAQAGADIVAPSDMMDG